MQSLPHWPRACRTPFAALHRAATAKLQSWATDLHDAEGRGPEQDPNVHKVRTKPSKW